MSEVVGTKKRKGHPVLLRLPDDMLARLRAESENRATPMATVARQLIKERLDLLERDSGHDQ
jgi:predicted DNA-binding protein